MHDAVFTTKARKLAAAHGSAVALARSVRKSPTCRGDRMRLPELPGHRIHPSPIPSRSARLPDNQESNQTRRAASIQVAWYCRSRSCPITSVIPQRGEARDMFGRADRGRRARTGLAGLGLGNPRRLLRWLVPVPWRQRRASGVASMLYPFSTTVFADAEQPRVPRLVS